VFQILLQFPALSGPAPVEKQHDLIKSHRFFLTLPMPLPYGIFEAADKTLSAPFDVRNV
jgi:hypothetical protein